MRKEIGLLFMSILLLGIVVASPPNPMAFYGNVEYAGTIPDGYYITAKINNAVHGQCLIINNKYGYGQNSCVVVSDQDNVLINFYIGNTLIGSAIFHNLEIVNLNFTLTALPPKPTPLSNGICEIHLGECSFNFLDCHLSLTSVCLGNGRCDVEIGETCENAPADCGVCPAPTTPSSGGSSGGGGGGGGGGGSSSTTLININLSSTSSANSGSSGLEIKDISEDKETTNTKGITGRTIDSFGDFAKSGYGIGLGIFIILLAVLAVINSKRNKEELPKMDVKKKK